MSDSTSIVDKYQLDSVTLGTWEVLNLISNENCEDKNVYRYFMTRLTWVHGLTDKDRLPDKVSR